MLFNPDTLLTLTFSPMKHMISYAIQVRFGALQTAHCLPFKTHDFLCGSSQMWYLSDALNAVSLVINISDGLQAKLSPSHAFVIPPKPAPLNPSEPQHLPFLLMLS